MKIRILSDLHIEFAKFTPRDTPADVVVLAGDISIGHHGIEWARDAFANPEIVYVLGNHEFYRGRYERVLEEAAETATKRGVHLLECGSVVVNGVRFLGTTLWTDFETAEEGEGDLAPQFQAHPLNPAFVSHMPDLVRKPVRLWIHGHTHASCDYVTEGTRVVCNPRGYVPHERNPRFDPSLTVEV